MLAAILRPEMMAVLTPASKIFENMLARVGGFVGLAGVAKYVILDLPGVLVKTRAGPDTVLYLQLPSIEAHHIICAC